MSMSKSDIFVFKSYYVVWKLSQAEARQKTQKGLNRTM